MLLNKVSVSNFKVLRNAEITFKPITLLLGTNNSGKSSLFQLLLAIKQTLESRNLNTPFVLEGPHVSLGSFTDMVFNHEISNEVSIFMDFAKPKSGVYRDIKNFPFLNIPFSISFKIRYDQRKEMIYLTHLKIWTQKEVYMEIENELLKVYRNKETIIPLKLNDTKLIQVARQRHFLWRLFIRSSDDIKIGTDVRYDFFMSRLNSQIEQFFSDFIFYLGPLREYPHRFYLSSGEKPSDVGLRGENTASLLYLEREKIIEIIKNWLVLLEMSKDLRPQKITEGIWKIELSDYETGIYSNLKDLGFGISQILPILVQSVNAPSGSYLMIEQPEIHLHPKIQADLADLFIELMKQEKYSIIETHSEHLVLRFARRIAEGILKKDDIAIYEFIKTQDGSEIHEVKFDDLGNLERWPANFFETELEETLSHIKAAGERSNNV